jgi:hypothetical protein
LLPGVFRGTTQSMCSTPCWSIAGAVGPVRSWKGLATVKLLCPSCRQLACASGLCTRVAYLGCAPVSCTVVVRQCCALVLFTGVVHRSCTPGLCTWVVHQGCAPRLCTWSVRLAASYSWRLHGQKRPGVGTLWPWSLHSMACALVARLAREDRISGRALV